MKILSSTFLPLFFLFSSSFLLLFLLFYFVPLFIFFSYFLPRFLLFFSSFPPFLLFFSSFLPLPLFFFLQFFPLFSLFLPPLSPFFSSLFLPFIPPLFFPFFFLVFPHSRVDFPLSPLLLWPPGSSPPLPRVSCPNSICQFVLSRAWLPACTAAGTFWHLQLQPRDAFLDFTPHTTG